LVKQGSLLSGFAVKANKNGIGEEEAIEIP
jgi:hypothetical protein